MKPETLKLLADQTVASVKDFVARALHPIATKLDSTDQLLVAMDERLEALERRCAEIEARRG